MTHEEYESKSQMKRVEILKAGEKKMTHEELLAKINEEDSSVALFVGARTSLADALRAVVELAFNKNEDVEFWSEEGQLGYEIAMHRVIQAIEKELK